MCTPQSAPKKVTLAPSAVMARKEEKLCWTLGGDLRKTPSPSEDFESAWCKGPGDSTPPKQIELPSSVNGPVPEELMNSVRSRVMFLEQLSFLMMQIFVSYPRYP